MIVWKGRLFGATTFGCLGSKENPQPLFWKVFRWQLGQWATFQRRLKVKKLLFINSYFLGKINVAPLISRYCYCLHFELYDGILVAISAYFSRYICWSWVFLAIVFCMEKLSVNPVNNKINLKLVDSFIISGRSFFHNMLCIKNKMSVESTV